MSQASLFNLMPERHIWKVSELTDRIRDLLEGAFCDIWVEGEVSNCHAAQSGHLYFTLKDAHAQIRCVCFRDQARGLKFRPEDGLHVTVRGSISVYDLRGEYQIYVTHIEPVGLGALQLAFEQLKKRLQDEGLFDESRKKPLPVLPRCIGVVTSPTGAAIRDILRVLKRRFPNVHVQLYPVKVQGEGAAEEIVAAVNYFNRAKFADVLIVARGGGSLEDLWAFNEEVVARAIAASEIPVITGVGHETDFTIADFVADLRAPTPSAAAELVVRSRQEFERHIAEHQRHLVQQIRYWFSERRHRVRDLQTHRGFRQLEILVRRRRQQVDELSSSLGDRTALAARHIAPARDEGERANRIVRPARACGGRAPPDRSAAPCADRSARASDDAQTQRRTARRKCDSRRSICAREWRAGVTWWKGASLNLRRPRSTACWPRSASASKPPSCSSKSAARSASSNAATPSPTTHRGMYCARRSGRTRRRYFGATRARRTRRNR